MTAKPSKDTESLLTANGSVNWCGRYGNQLSSFSNQTLKVELSHDPAADPGSAPQGLHAITKMLACRCSLVHY